MYYIYQITNLINNKTYIGQTKNPAIRWKQHKKNSKNPTMVIHQAMKKHKIENFKFEVILMCKESDANGLETLIVEQNKSHISLGKGYNVSLGGNNAPKTEAWKQMISDKFTGTKASEEAKENMRLAKIGVLWTEERIKNFTGRKLTKEHSENISKSLMGHKINLGKKQSPETIAKRIATRAKNKENK